MSYVSINGHTIRANKLHNRNDPPIRIARTKSDAKPRYAHEIAINGPSKLIYNPDGAILKCGARLVIETAHEVEIIR